MPAGARTELRSVVLTNRSAAVGCFAMVVFGILSCNFTANALAADVPTPATQPSSSPAERIWVEHVQPILAKSCINCHGGTKLKGGLDLREPKAIFAGGTDGSVVMPGRPADSPLYQRLLVGDEGHMPPLKEPQPSTEEVAFIHEWIARLPNPEQSPTAATSRDWNQSAPTLMEMATRIKWQPPAGIEGSGVIDHLVHEHWKQQQVE